MVFEILTILFCLFLIAILSLVLVALIVSRKIMSTVSRLFSDDIAHLERKAEKLRSKFPNDSDDQIIARITKGEARLAGITGFFTGLFGIITLPIALPLDIFATIRIQYRLVKFLLSKNRDTEPFFDTDRMKVLGVVFGSNRLSRFGGKFAVMTISKYAPHVILKSIPILGGIIGFLMDYFGTKAVAEFAQRKISGEK